MKKKKYLWIRKTEVFEAMMEHHEVTTSALQACNWHECEYCDDEYVRVTIDWGKTGDRNVVLKEPEDE